jgi:hypothetical protein
MIRLKQRREAQTQALEPNQVRMLSKDPALDKKLEQALGFVYSRICDGYIGAIELKARLSGAEAGGREGRYLVRNGNQPIYNEQNQTILTTSEQVLYGTTIGQSTSKQELIDLVLFKQQAAGNSRETNFTTRGLSYFLSEVATRRMGFLELSARLTGAEAGGREGRILVRNGNQPIYNEQRQTILTTSEQVRYGEKIGSTIFAPILKIATKNLVAANGSLALLKRQVAGLNYFISEITSGKMGLIELSARLTGAEAGGREGRYLVRNGNQPIYNEQRQSILTTAEQVRISQSLTDLKINESILTFGRCITQKKYGQAVANAMSASMRSQTAEPDQLITQLFLAEGNQVDAEPLIRCAVDLRNTLRTKQFELDFYTKLTSLADASDLARLVETLDLATDQDRELRLKCLELTRDKRRIDIMRDALNVLGTGATEQGSPAAILGLIDQRPSLAVRYEKALEVLRPLSISKFDDDKNAALAVIELMGKVELAQLKVNAANLVKPEMTRAEVDKYLESFPLRASVGKSDYRAQYEETKAFLEPQVDFACSYQRLLFGNQIRAATNLSPVRTIAPALNLNGSKYDGLLEQVLALDFGLKDDANAQNILLGDLRAASSIDDKPAYTRLFAGEITLELKRQSAESFDMPNLGRNRAASNFINNRFRLVMNPLLQALRKDRSSAGNMDNILGKDPVSADGTTIIKRGKKLPFEISIERLSQQRDLSEIEKIYLESVERLSRLNPSLVAMMNSAPAETFEYLRAYFFRESAKTWGNLKDGDYVPAVLCGYGAHGIAAMGEIARLNPELASNLLVIDLEELPGGPFSIPRGPAWELNSANSRGTREVKLPDPSNLTEESTVRAYGSPIRWYPGERSVRDPDTRGGGINTVTDYLPTPDNISDFRYPTNHEFALIAQVQAALLTKNLSTSTELISRTRNSNSDQPGSTILTLKKTFPDGTSETKRIYTDAFLGTTGLGGPSYGFKLEGSRAKRIIDQPTKPANFPKLSTTLGAFRALADETITKLKVIGDTIVIYGNGNSTDTLLENIGNLFSQSNPIVRNITKIYVIAEGDFSARPRYLRILDLQSRGGRGNLVEVIKGRVADIDFATNGSEKLVFLNSNGQPYTNGGAKPILADHGISAAGFKSTIKSILAGVSPEFAQDQFEPIPLPTNNKVYIGERLKSDPNTIILGTGSSPFFNNDKKMQLPTSASNALARVGGENAVAIGFRVPETQAGIRIWVSEREFTFSPAPEPLSNAVNFYFTAGSGVECIDVVLNSNKLPSLSEAVSNNLRFATAQLGALLKEQNFTFIEGTKRATRKLGFEISLSKDGSSLTIASNEEKISVECANAIKSTFMDPFLQAYTLKALQAKRSQKGLVMSIKISNGSISLNDTFID